MADVITETDIRKFEGMSRAVVPVGAILTPAAKDWAFEHHLAITFGSENGSESPAVANDGKDKEVLLQQVVKLVVHNINKNGTAVPNDVVVSIVVGCLEQMGCQVR